MPRRTPKTPQQKKAESLTHDRRNAFGENAKSSRKSIPRRKRNVEAANRAQAAIPLRQPSADAESLEQTQEAVESQRPTLWKKSADIPLHAHIAKQAARQATRSDRKTRRDAGLPNPNDSTSLP